MPEGNRLEKIQAALAAGDEAERALKYILKQLKKAEIMGTLGLVTNTKGAAWKGVFKRRYIRNALGQKSACLEKLHTFVVTLNGISASRVSVPNKDAFLQIEAERNGITEEYQTLKQISKAILDTEQMMKRIRKTLDELRSIAEKSAV